MKSVDGQNVVEPFKEKKIVEALAVIGHGLWFTNKIPFEEVDAKGNLAVAGMRNVRCGEEGRDGRWRNGRGGRVIGFEGCDGGEGGGCGRFTTDGDGLEVAAAVEDLLNTSAIQGSNRTLFRICLYFSSFLSKSMLLFCMTCSCVM